MRWMAWWVVGAWLAVCAACADDSEAVPCPDCLTGGPGSSSSSGTGAAPGAQLVWALGWGDSADQEAQDVAVDSADNTYVAGFYSGTLDLGGGKTLDAGTAYDMFVVKLDAAGAPVWVHPFGQTGEQEPDSFIQMSVAVDRADNLAIAGNVVSETTLGLSNPVTLLQGTAIDAPIFVAKLDADGARIWSVEARDLGGPVVRDVACDASGHVVVVGEFEASSGEIFGYPFNTADGGRWMFVAKLDGMTGTPMWSWAYQQLATNPVEPSVDVGPDGEVLVAGILHATMDIEGTVYESSGNPVPDLLLIRYAADGTLGWVETFGDEISPQQARGVGVGDDGALYLTGPYQGTLDFGGEPLVSRDATTWDMYVAKLDGSGTEVWADGYNGLQAQLPDALDLRGEQLAVTGLFQQGLPLATPELASLGSDDLFVASLALDGTVAWARSLGGPFEQYGRSVAIGPTGAVIVAGFSAGDIELGGGEILANGGGRDVLVARFER